MKWIIKYPLCFLLCILICVPVGMAREDIWTEVKSPNFTVISDGSPKQARRAARSFEQFRLLLQNFLGASKLKVDPGSPLIVFAMRDGNGMKELLPEERRAKNAAPVSGIFMGNQDEHFVVLRLDVPNDQAYHTSYHEYVHMIMRLNFQKLPLWLNEGLAELFAFTELSDGTSSLGNYSPEQIQQLQKYSMMPLPVLLTVTPDSPYYLQADKMRIFYAQSWALTHYFALGDKAAHAKQLDQFISLLQSSVSEEEAIARAFGDIKILERNLGTYISQSNFYHYKVPTQLDVKEDQYSARTLTQAESLASRGHCLIAAGRLDDAKAMFEQALQLDSRSADANEGLGLFFLIRGNREQAQKYFTSAAQLDSKSFLAQYYAGQSEYEGGENYDAAERYLRKAIEINSGFVPAHSMLAQLLMMQKTRLPEALDLAVKAAKLEPAEPRHRLNLCRVLIAMERYDEASKIAGNVATAADTESVRRMADSIVFEIQDRKNWTNEQKKREEALRQRAKEIAERRKEIAAAESPRPSETGQAKAPVAPIKRGPARKTVGVIKSVQCSYPAIMDIVLDSDGRQQKLRAENYYKVQYESVGGPGKTEFEPCQELQGKTVQIEFQSVVGQEFSGFIQKCGIVK